MIPAETFIRWRESLASETNRRKVSQAQAADRLGIPPRTYQRWEEKGCSNDAMALALGAVAYGLPPYR